MNIISSQIMSALSRRFFTPKFVQCCKCCSMWHPRNYHSLRSQTDVSQEVKSSSQSQYPMIPSFHLTKRFQSSSSTSVLDQTWWNNFKYTMGGIKSKIPGLSRELTNPKVTLSGFTLYLCCAQVVDHHENFEVLQLPNTFNSWFLLTELHVWMVMVKLSKMGDEGITMRNCMIEALWEDCEKRAKLLGTVSRSARRDGIDLLGNVFLGSLFAYDEGLLGDDKTLAGAVWRTLFEQRDTDPGNITLMVEYIRKQIKHVSAQDERSILFDGVVTFLPLYGDREDPSRDLRKLINIYDNRISPPKPSDT
ncbi:ubiquinol-cytochrome-c reductase complex assembly factor 1-like [Gigantopelta aegis]|uniref:ubiquinol-cytochrome-c reductase complex assembly factor 1-like n=1 Tax=Gigantopelta aegis TaxID=1735272 RepID=UPI001B88D24B|nr:ubiquinol-cytochrome-c reductase complex assembly factor 1-like [Gigantopelta aegis]